MKANQNNLQNTNNTTLAMRIWNHRWYYVMLLPLIAWYIAFSYFPMYGASLAFKTFKFNLGILKSPWNDFANFKNMMGDSGFWRAFRNTITISFGKLLFHFPLPVMLAIVMHELSGNKRRRLFQSVFTFPHLISWVVLAGIITNLFSSSGVFNQLLTVLKLPNFSPLTQVSSFRPMIYITHVWKEIGWDSIIYIAALTGIGTELYEAATIDGANRFQRILNVSWPGIRSTVVIMLILAVGNTMGIGSSFDQIFNLYSSPVFEVADTIDTFIYRTTFTTGADFGYMTAIGLFKSIVNLIMLFTANTVVRRFGEQGLY